MLLLGDVKCVRIFLTNMMKDTIPHSGIDTDARWGYGKTKGWIFRYKLQMTFSTG